MDAILPALGLTVLILAAVVLALTLFVLGVNKYDPSHYVRSEEEQEERG